MKIYCGGRAYDIPAGAGAGAVLRMTGVCREGAVLAEWDGMEHSLQTPVPEGKAVSFLGRETKAGYLACQRTLVLLLLCALKNLKGSTEDVAVKHSLGAALYCEFTSGHTPLARELEDLEEEMRRIAASDVPIVERTVMKSEADASLRRKGRHEEADMLDQLPLDSFSIYRLGEAADYFFGPLCERAGDAGPFQLTPYAPGFLLRFPERGGKEMGRYQEEPLFAKVFLEAERWGRVAGCRNVTELNHAIGSGRINDLIAMAEALHEKKLAHLADVITREEPFIRLVCIAGPSSAGKTTFMKRLLVHLWVNGVRPVMVSLDDFYKERQPGEVREAMNYEDLQALDIGLFQEIMGRLLEGGEARLPHFDFKTGKRSWSSRTYRLGVHDPVMVEGLHALHPEISHFVPGYQCIHIYLGALTQISLNRHNRISTSDTRLLRRMVRDARDRGMTAEETLRTWGKVRSGEERNIFPYQDRADQIFNTALLYELPVLKKLASPLLQAIPEGSSLYGEAQRLLTFLAPFRELDQELVPDHSILREFIGARRSFPFADCMTDPSYV